MEQQGRKYKVSEIEIFIPNTYISLDAINKYQQKDIVIRDLPGVNAENVNEQSYVIKSVEDKVNMADIAILMSKIDDLSKLINPKHLEVRPHESDSHYRCKYLHRQQNRIAPPKRHELPPRIQKQIETACAWFYEWSYPPNGSTKTGTSLASRYMLNIY